MASPTKLDKHAAYRRRCVAAGRCPHCGKPCAPYYECDDRRFAKQMQYALRRMVAAGMLDSVLDTKGRRAYGMADKDVHIRSYRTRENDPRRQPRMKKKPVDGVDIVQQALNNIWQRTKNGATEEQIMKKIGAMRLAAISAYAA